MNNDLYWFSEKKRVIEQFENRDDEVLYLMQVFDQRQSDLIF